MLDNKEFLAQVYTQEKWEHMSTRKHGQKHPQQSSVNSSKLEMNQMSKKKHF